jgi:CubicO group peptidase (beta-lactamase class C family)
MTTFSSRLYEALSPFIENGEVSGVVATVADTNGIIAEAELGYADIAAKRPMTADTFFWVASQTKPFTGTAVMMLVDDGKLLLDEPIEKTLPEFEKIWVIAESDDEQLNLIRPVRSLTLRDVLSHTSGMPFSSPVERPVLDRLPLENAVYSYAITPLTAQPGTKYAYSNAGVNTAARMIEVVTGQSFEGFLQDRLFDPLGMTDTTFFPSSEQVSRLAKTYEADSEKKELSEIGISQLTYPLDRIDRFAMPAGGLFSSSKDLVKFCTMILNGGLASGKHYISENAIAEMSKKQTPDHIENNYGLGWSVGNGSFGHGGACSTNMMVYPKIGRASSFLVQHTSFAGDGARIRDVFEEVAQSE